MKKLLLSVVMFLLLITGAVTQREFLLTSYARFFTVHNATRGADALVVLSGGIITRLPCAIELYKQGYAPRIILTEQRHPFGRLRQVGGDEWSIAAAIIQALHATVNLVKVPSLKGGATSTFDEAYDLREYSVKHHLKHLIIVTDDHHTRRSLYAFEKVLRGTGIKVEAAGTKNDIFNESNWWQSDTGISSYVMEGIKYVVYRFSDRNVSFIKNY